MLQRYLLCAQDNTYKGSTSRASFLGQHTIHPVPSQVKKGEENPELHQIISKTMCIYTGRVIGRRWEGTVECLWKLDPEITSYECEGVGLQVCLSVILTPVQVSWAS